MTPRELALVAAYEAARPLGRSGMPNPRHAAGALVKAHGSAKAALARWLVTGARLPYPNERARAWADGVGQTLRETIGEEAN